MSVRPESITVEYIGGNQTQLSISPHLLGRIKHALSIAARECLSDVNRADMREIDEAIEAACRLAGRDGAATVVAKVHA